MPEVKTISSAAESVEPNHETHIAPGKSDSVSDANAQDQDEYAQTRRNKTQIAPLSTANAAKVQGHTGCDYPDFFDVREYVSSRFGGGVESPNSCQPLPFQMKCYHEFYESFHSRWDASSARLLELGGGTSIYPLISACPHISEIVFADYTPSMLREVRLWKYRDPMAFDWSVFFQYHVNRLEGKEGKGAWLEREEMLRGKITSLEHCDITKPYPVDKQLGKFDIVSTAFCLESVPNTTEEYEQFLRHVANVTSIGGYIIMLVSIGMSRYRISGEDFKHLALSLDSTRTFLENAGFTVEMERYYPLEDYRRVIGQSDCQGKAFFAGRRVM